MLASKKTTAELGNSRNTLIIVGAVIIAILALVLLFDRWARRSSGLADTFQNEDETGKILTLGWLMLAFVFVIWIWLKKQK